MTFAQQIYTLARLIPPGKVATYGQLAALAGRPNAARAVGACMRGCTEPGVPCHRVVFHNGAICGGDAFDGIPMLQRRLLQEEGAAFLRDGRVDLRQSRWEGATNQ